MFYMILRPTWPESATDQYANQADCKRKGLQRKGKEEYLYSAFSHQGTYKALRHGSHSFTQSGFTCKQHHACLSFVAFTRCRHHSNWGNRHLIAAQYSFIDPERLSWVVVLDIQKWIDRCEHWGVFNTCVHRCSLSWVELSVDYWPVTAK